MLAAPPRFAAPPASLTASLGRAGGGALHGPGLDL